MQLLLKAAAALAVLYGLFIAAAYYVMSRPPDRLAHIIAKMPGPLFMTLPFETLWSAARAGDLRTGDSAPDFSLDTHDKSARVTLSSFQGQKPVVLIFGSYT